METTRGTLLGGRVEYVQPREGYRTGIEPVLLAASVPAQAGQVVLEAGTGAGAGLLCLAARVAGVGGIGVELDPEMAELARDNFVANGFVGLSVMTGDVTQMALPAVDHAMANPPWHDPAGTLSPIARRRLATHEDAGVEVWVAALGRAVRAGGSLTMIVPPGLVSRVASAGEIAGLGMASRVMLVPKLGREPKMVIMQAWRGRGQGRVGTERRIILHETDGAYTTAIDAVLRRGAALDDNA